MNDRLLREYVATALREGGYWTRPGESDKKKKPKKGQSFFSKVKSFFSGTSKPDEISSDWLEDQEMYFDVDLTEEFEEEVKKFVRSKYDLAARRARGDEEKTEALMRKALDSRYKKRLRELEAQLDKLDDEEEE